MGLALPTRFFPWSILESEIILKGNQAKYVPFESITYTSSTCINILIGSDILCTVVLGECNLG